MRFSCLILVVAACLVAADDPPRAVPKEAQQAFEPRSGPGAGQAYLARFAGDWHVAKTFFPRTGEPARTEGTCRQTMIHDGRFLQSDFVFNQGATTSTGMGLIGFEPETGTFTSVWTDSRQTRISFRHSRGKFDGDQIVLFSSDLDPAPKDARRSKTVSKIDESGNRLVHRQYALARDSSERLMMELVLTRKAKQDAPAKP